MNQNISPKEITDYFRSNIFEAFSAYNAWKMIYFSRSKNIVSSNMAERYVEIQKYHVNFFVATERAFLVNFIMMSLHPFDKRDDSFSLYKISKEKMEGFVKENNVVLDKLKIVRNKLFAHRDNEASNNSYDIPSIDNLDCFFKKLIDFYNQLTSEIDSSTTEFTNATEVKQDIEILFQNLYRGESMRKLEIDIKYQWEEDNQKASNTI